MGVNGFVNLINLKESSSKNLSQNPKTFYFKSKVLHGTCALQYTNYNGFFFNFDCKPNLFHKNNPKEYTCKICTYLHYEKGRFIFLNATESEIWMHWLTTPRIKRSLIWQEYFSFSNHLFCVI